MTTEFHLAQFNVARRRAPLTDPLMSGFVAGLDAMNALADVSPGFIWRLAEGPDGDATTVHPLDPDVIVTMSVWDSVESLRAFSYQSAHLDYLRRRRDWFRPHDFPASLVLWWIPAGHIPTVEEACERLELVAVGPSPEAFTFRRTFPAPELTARHVVEPGVGHRREFRPAGAGVTSRPTPHGMATVETGDQRR